MSVAALGLLGGLLLVWSGRSGWGREHVLLVAAGPLVATMAASFFVVDPLGCVVSGAVPEQHHPPGRGARLAGMGVAPDPPGATRCHRRRWTPRASGGWLMTRSRDDAAKT
jgi:hypothetical protein